MMIFHSDVAVYQRVWSEWKIYTWLVVDLHPWKIWIRQLGRWHSQLNGKIKNVPNHQPVAMITGFFTMKMLGTWTKVDGITGFFLRAHWEIPMILCDSLGFPEAEGESCRWCRPITAISTRRRPSRLGTLRLGDVIISSDVSTLW